MDLLSRKGATEGTDWSVWKLAGSVIWSIIPSLLLARSLKQTAGSPSHRWQRGLSLNSAPSGASRCAGASCLRQCLPLKAVPPAMKPKASIRFPLPCTRLYHNIAKRLHVCPQLWTTHGLRQNVRCVLCSGNAGNLRITFSYSFLYP